MKKRDYIAYLLIGILGLSLFGCGSSTQPAETTTEEAAEAAETTEEAAPEAKTYPEEAYVSNLKVDDYVEVADYSEIGKEIPSISTLKGKKTALLLTAERQRALTWRSVPAVSSKVSKKA